MDNEKMQIRKEKTARFFIIGLLMGQMGYAQTLDERFNEYKREKTECLSPFPGYFTPLAEPRTTKVPDAYVSWTGSEIRMDKESPKPLIIKISQTKYLIYRGYDYLIHEIEEGGETLFDAFWGIQKPPPPPNKGDSSDGWKDDNDRWDYKP